MDVVEKRSFIGVLVMCGLCECKLKEEGVVERGCSLESLSVCRSRECNSNVAQV
jgi:hypothetical protein